MPRLSGHIRRVQSFRMLADILNESITLGLPEVFHGELERLGEDIAARAKSYLGRPQPPAHGGFPPWPPLAPATLAKKGANTPLYETGRLADSIEYSVEKEENRVTIGSNLRYARFHELGTSKMSARPFLHPAAEEVVAERGDLIGEAVVTTLVDFR